MPSSIRSSPISTSIASKPARSTATGVEHFLRLREDNKPGLIFSARISANWELPAIVARKFNLDLSILFRLPKNSLVAEDLMERRNQLMGNLVPSRLGTTFEIAGILAKGEHVGMLVDQRRHGSPLMPFSAGRRRQAAACPSRPPI